MLLHLAFVLNLLVAFVQSEEDSTAARCQSSYDCPKYYYCDNFNQFPVTSGRPMPVIPEGNCVTQYQKLSHDQTISCSSIASDGRTTYPDHDRCKRWDMRLKNLTSIFESTMACFPDLDYTCAKSYLTPCLPRYDKEGNRIPRRKRDCPISGFMCGSNYYRNHEGTLTHYRACEVPLADEFDPTRHLQTECYTSLQCAWSGNPAGRDAASFWPGGRGSTNRVLAKFGTTLDKMRTNVAQNWTNVDKCDTKLAKLDRYSTKLTKWEIMDQVVNLDFDKREVPESKNICSFIRFASI